MEALRSPPATTVSPSSRLIFDLGMNNGEDSLGYLRMGNGYRVVAVEANKGFVDMMARAKMPRLAIINRAIVEDDSNRTNVTFCLAGQGGVSSHVKGTTNRCDTPIVVPTTTCGDLVHEHGRPWLVKIDIEGKERACIDSLLRKPHNLRPLMIDFESPLRTCRQVLRHCAADFQQLVREMEAAGYTEWKRQRWKTQDGHSHIGDNVLDLGRSRHWTNASEVRRVGCGKDKLPAHMSDLKSVEYSRRGNPWTLFSGSLCDFHARLSSV